MGLMISWRGLSGTQVLGVEKSFTEVPGHVGLLSAEYQGAYRTQAGECNDQVEAIGY